MEYWSWTDNNIKVFTDKPEQIKELAKIGKTHSKYYKNERLAGIDVIVKANRKKLIEKKFNEKLDYIL